MNNNPRVGRYPSRHTVTNKFSVPLSAPRIQCVCRSYLRRPASKYTGWKQRWTRPSDKPTQVLYFTESTSNPGRCSKVHRAKAQICCGTCYRRKINKIRKFVFCKNQDCDRYNCNCYNMIVKSCNHFHIFSFGILIVKLVLSKIKSPPDDANAPTHSSIA